MCHNFVGNLELRGVLVGNNAGINSIDFDSTGSFVLGTSNDYAIRVWSASDHRLRVKHKFVVEHERQLTRFVFVAYSHRSQCQSNGSKISAGTLESSDW